MSTIEFSTQFDRLRRTLFSFALNLTKDEESARDLVQETAYKAFKYWHRYEPQTNLRAWLMTIMRNSFINEYRKRKRRQTLNDSTNNDFLIDSGQQTVMNQGESGLMSEEILRVIEQLEDWVRIPFLMHFRGFKYEEIAEELEVPLGTIKSRIFFARQKLQAQMRGMYSAKQIEDILG
ncbi:MAG TPA: RNA polymerase sigma factor [Haliscomenobacter sp.]|uniref:RNA polymerase sigma factor n=1 Tax=Haliscomenobacter sp. TaxID=2717303 RepID=UPI001D584E8C|nr:RNA polymerase sigma factor [Haliscomenobacter sp.]MBK9488071.1 RNA polymerase sigma factor [Haliscomenobacter sp.]HOY20679.1 RNA polymerase sigma factor [Haliscomenobacter sp.]HPH20166.1 RNA polymerase sigma factor [Haliscomenobacter sp.]